MPRNSALKSLFSTLTSSKSKPVSTTATTTTTTSSSKPSSELVAKASAAAAASTQAVFLSAVAADASVGNVQQVLKFVRRTLRGRVWGRALKKMIRERAPLKAPEVVVFFSFSPPPPLSSLLLFFFFSLPRRSTILGPVSRRGCAPTRRLAEALSWREKRTSVGERGKGEGEEEKKKDDCLSSFSLARPLEPVFVFFSLFSPVARKAKKREKKVAFRHAFSLCFRARSPSPLAPAMSHVEDAAFGGDKRGDAWTREARAEGSASDE